MGVSKIDTILMVLAVSLKMTELEREVTTSLMIQGFDSIALEANTSVTGGQTILNPWPIIGGAAFCSVPETEYILPNQAEIGDKIILTKPLGTQMAVNVYQWFRNQNEKWNIIKEMVKENEVVDAYESAAKYMSRLNKNAGEVMIKYKTHGATDVTGFGILGHANYLANAQKNNVDFVIHTLPVLKKMFNLGKTEARNFKFKEGFSAETSGGLFICVQNDKVNEVLKELKEKGEFACVIGDVVEGKKEAKIIKDFNLLEVL